MTEIALSVVGGATGASALGSSHIARGKPNQDAVAWQQRRLWTYIAVADGHGSAPHYRSDRGSRMAIDTLIGLFRQVTRDGALREPEALARRIPDLASALVARWREKVDADISKEPIPEPAGFPSHTVYGSTCLGAAIGPGLVLALQIGDGDLFAGAASGDIAHLFEADDTVGEQTYSLCLPDAAEHVKIALFTAPSRLCAPDFVFAATDGFAKSFDNELTVLDMVRGYRSAVRERGLERVSSELPDWLAKCSQMGSGDDTSVAIFTADVESARPFAELPIEAERRSGAEASAIPDKRGKFAGPAAVAGALVCGAIGGVLVGFWGAPFIDRFVSGPSPRIAPSPVSTAPVTQPIVPGVREPAAPAGPTLPDSPRPGAPLRPDDSDSPK